MLTAMFPFKSACTGVNAADPRRSDEIYKEKAPSGYDLRTKKTKKTLRGLQKGDCVDASVGDRNVRKRLNRNETISALSAIGLHKP